jgi:hypothetical protein
MGGFYYKMEEFIVRATEESKSLTELLTVIARDINLLEDEEIFGNILDKIEKANEASFLVYTECLRYTSMSQKSISWIISWIKSQVQIE